jgi:hypothetical protein
MRVLNLQPYHCGFVNAPTVLEGTSPRDVPASE